MSIKQTRRGFTYPATTDRMNTSQRSQVELIKSKASCIAIYFFCFPRIKETAYKALVRPTGEYCTTGIKDLGSLHKGCFPLRRSGSGSVIHDHSDHGAFQKKKKKKTDASTLDKEPSVLLMQHGPSDLGSLILIWIIPKEHTLRTFGCKRRPKHE